MLKNFLRVRSGKRLTALGDRICTGEKAAEESRWPQTVVITETEKDKSVFTMWMSHALEEHIASWPKDGNGKSWWRKLCHQGEDLVPRAHNIERRLWEIQVWRLPGSGPPPKKRGRTMGHLLQGTAVGGGYGGNILVVISAVWCACVFVWKLG